MKKNPRIRTVLHNEGIYELYGCLVRWVDKRGDAKENVRRQVAKNTHAHASLFFSLQLLPSVAQPHRFVITFFKWRITDTPIAQLLIKLLVTNLSSCKIHFRSSFSGYSIFLFKSAKKYFWNNFHNYVSFRNNIFFKYIHQELEDDYLLVVCETNIMSSRH